MKILIVPTLNEKKNISNMFNKIKRLNRKLDLLFIDDNSTDGTRDEILKFCKKNRSVSYIFRPKKMGIGSAHKDGLKYAYRKKYKFILTMDADGTHNPKYLNNFLKHSKNYDLVSTNRFIKKNSLKEWPIQRRFLTSVRYYLINTLLDLNYDSSGAFRCYNTKKIKLRDILLAKNNGYSFFWESLYFLNKKKYTIKEIPIFLPYRKIGRSKMTIKDIIGSVLYLFKYSLKKP